MKKINILYALLGCLAFIIMALPSFAATTNYVYDDLLRLKSVSRSDGVVITYNYDEAGNRTRKIVTVTPPADTTAPVVGTFTVPSTASSLTVTDIILSATDAVGVTGYMLTESSDMPDAGATGWSGTTAPTSYTFSISGSKILYAWAKDAAGNVSLSMSVTVTIILPAPTVPNGVTVQYQPAHSWNYITWNAVSGATDYKVYWGTTPGITTGSNAMPLTNTTDYGHSSVVAGSTYYYRVAAVNSNGESALSNEVSATVPPALTYGQLNVTASSDSEIYTPVNANYQYRYGASIILNGDTFDMWTAAPNPGLMDLMTHRKGRIDAAGNVQWLTNWTNALLPTPNSEDHYSVCDPSVIYFNGYYYVGYTSTKSANGAVNQVFVARCSNLPDNVATATCDKWNGSGWGGNPQPIIKYTGTGWGKGQPSFVVKGNTLYMYYTDGGTKVVTVDATNPIWPSLIDEAQAVTVLTNAEATITLGGKPGPFEVKYIDKYGKFIGIGVSGEFGSGSNIFVYESNDGISFQPVATDKSYWGSAPIQQFAHNIGISGDSAGHLDANANNFVAYGVGLPASQADAQGYKAKWPTYLNLVSVTAPVINNQSYTLTITKSGTGSVSASTGAISWIGNTGTASYNSNISVTLSATADPGSTFSGWSGDCSGTLPTCTVTMTTAMSVTATFTSNSYPLTVTKDGTGSGTVTPDVGTLSWTDNTGTVTYNTGTPVKLTAQANSGSAFTGWSGTCTGTQQPCQVTMATAKNVGATFADTAAPTFNISSLASGSFTAAPLINFFGKVLDNIAVQSLTIDGNTVPVNIDGSFSAPVVLDPDNAIINTVATDAAGNQTTDSRTVTFDQLLPTLTITAPTDNSTRNKNYCTVSGTIADPTATVAVSVNSGTPQQAAITGTSYSATVNLAAGLNTIQTTVTDLNGAKNSIKRTVISDNQHATVSITSPAQDMETTTATMTLSGSVTDAVTPVTVSITNGANTYTPTVSSSGTFSQALIFTEVKNYPIIVTVTENNGKVTTVQRNVLFQKTNALKSASSPTKLANLTISGTMETGTIVSVDCPTVTTVGTVTYPTVTTWSCLLTGLTEGKNPLTVTFTSATNPDMTATKIIIFDTIAPTEGTFAASPEFALVKLAWSGFSDTNSGIYSYKIYSSTTAMPATCSGTTIYYGTAKAYSHTGLTNGTTYYYRLCASDAAGNVSTGVTASAKPNLYPLTITTASPLSSVTVSTSFTTSLFATGGVQPYTWSLASGTLPTGLTLNVTTGTLSGTPTIVGSYTFTIQVKDSQATPVTISKAFPLAVIPQSLAITTVPPLTSATIGTSYSKGFSATGGVKPYSWSLAAGSLPPGLALNATTGYISGTPTTAGAYNFSLKVTDSQLTPATATKDFSLTVVVAPLTISTVPPLTNATVGTSYAKSFAATGGIKPYTWSLVGASLPPGIILNASTGYLTGTPTAAGTYNFTLKVTDSQATPATVTKGFILTVVVAPLTISTVPPLTNATVGTSYAKAFTAIGGIKPYNWSLAAGSLPPGIILNATTGVISGTPTTAGTYSLTLKVTDSQTTPATVTKDFILTVVVAPLTITTVPPFTNATVGTSYSKSFAATGGIKPYTWSLAAGSLPTGLILNANTGYISGTPTTAGTYYFTVKVTDGQATQATASRDYNLTVVVGPLAITTTSPLTTATVGTSYGKSLVATGGIKPYTWSLTAASLPPGLTLNVSTGAITGVPTTAGSYSFTISVIDSQSPAVSVSKTFTMDVVIGPLTIITTSPLANATVGVTYSKTFSATGGIKPYTWSLVGGSLPPGLSINSTGGYVSGKPTTAGNFLFVIEGRDSQGAITLKSFSVDVLP